MPNTTKAPAWACDREKLVEAQGGKIYLESEPIKVQPLRQPAKKKILAPEVYRARAANSDDLIFLEVSRVSPNDLILEQLPLPVNFHHVDNDLTNFHHSLERKIKESASKNSDPLL